jgi:hypothetical protein
MVPQRRIDNVFSNITSMNALLETLTRTKISGAHLTFSRVFCGYLVFIVSPNRDEEEHAPKGMERRVEHCLP